MSHEQFILLIPGLPLLAAMLIGLLGPRLLRGQSHWPAIIAVAGSFCAAAGLLFNSGPMFTAGPVRGTLYTWFAAGDFAATISYNYDPLAAFMLLTVTLISMLVLFYSRRYMAGEPGYARYFAIVSLFVFAMCTLVLADNFLLLFLGWEGVGLCSYLLIGHYQSRPSAAAAAKKAFIVNRVGDLGMIMGILLIFATFGSLDFRVVLEPMTVLNKSAGDFHSLRWIAWLLLAGAVGKSGQLLLHVWLPDAMEGPSPVSALIHAATMVTAGVYLLARTSIIFSYAEMLPAVATLGTLTALFAAIVAVVQTDIKRVLAWSTISQLGYMFLGVGAGVSGNAIFHLFTHAFFKALLFLGAGAVMHALAGELDIRRMSGLRRKLPLTSFTFLLGCLALAGIVPFAGFFSKEPILDAAFSATWASEFGRATWGQSLPWLAHTLGLAALATSGLTAFYAFRLYMRVFRGPEVLPESVHGHLHRPDVWMLMPMVLLAIGAMAAGWFGTPILSFLTGTRGYEPHLHLGDLLPHNFVHVLTNYSEPADWFALAGLIVPFVGMLLAVWLYGPLRNWTTRPGAERSWLYQLAANRFYFDKIYAVIIVRPMRHLARLFVRIDDAGIDSALVGVTWAPRGIGWSVRLGRQAGIGGYAIVFAAGAALLIGLMIALSWAWR